MQGNSTEHVRLPNWILTAPAFRIERKEAGTWDFERDLQADHGSRSPLADFLACFPWLMVTRAEIGHIDSKHVFLASRDGASQAFIEEKERRFGPVLGAEILLSGRLYWSDLDGTLHKSCVEDAADVLFSRKESSLWFNLSLACNLFTNQLRVNERWKRRLGRESVSQEKAAPRNRSLLQASLLECERKLGLVIGYEDSGYIDGVFRYGFREDAREE